MARWRITQYGDHNHTVAAASGGTGDNFLDLHGLKEHGWQGWPLFNRPPSERTAIKHSNIKVLQTSHTVCSVALQNICSLMLSWLNFFAMNWILAQKREKNIARVFCCCLVIVKLAFNYCLPPIWGSRNDVDAILLYACRQLHTFAKWSGARLQVSGNVSRIFTPLALRWSPPTPEGNLWLLSCCIFHCCSLQDNESICLAFEPITVGEWSQKKKRNKNDNLKDSKTLYKT